MANKAQFISETFLKETTNVSSNMDWKEIKPFVLLSQDIYSTDLLGSTLYETLKAKLIAGTLNANETVLLEMLKPCLAWWTCFKLYRFMATKAKQKGMVGEQGPADVRAAETEVSRLTEEAKVNAEWYAQRIVFYLYKNSSLFPDYTNPGNADIYPANTGYNMQIGFDITGMSQEDLQWYRKYLAP